MTVLIIESLEYYHNINSTFSHLKKSHNITSNGVLRRHLPLSRHTGKSARNSTTPGKKDQGSSGGTLNFVFRLYVLQLDVDPCSRITNYFVHRRVISGDAPKFFYFALFFKERLVLFSKSGRFSNLCTSAKCPKNVNRQ